MVLLSSNCHHQEDIGPTSPCLYSLLLSCHYLENRCHSLDLYLSVEYCNTVLQIRQSIDALAWSEIVDETRILFPWILKIRRFLLYLGSSSRTEKGRHSHRGVWGVCCWSLASGALVRKTTSYHVRRGWPHDSGVCDGDSSLYSLDFWGSGPGSRSKHSGDICVVTCIICQIAERNEQSGFHLFYVNLLGSLDNSPPLEGNANLVLHDWYSFQYITHENVEYGSCCRVITESDNQSCEKMKKSASASIHRIHLRLCNCARSIQGWMQLSCKLSCCYSVTGLSRLSSSTHSGKRWSSMFVWSLPCPGPSNLGIYSLCCWSGEELFERIAFVEANHLRSHQTSMGVVWRS